MSTSQSRVGLVGLVEFTLSSWRGFSPAPAAARRNAATSKRLLPGGAEAPPLRGSKSTAHQTDQTHQTDPTDPTDPTDQT